ncbi:molecular chaperone TorD family protein [Metallosphaera tengchongensis]|uniref:Molecular chaperone TorD family protein n=1 Tax=Metallosphaera tengchongensis TaxID=1532350 RepID=A0A6N0NZN0_9CREN|nr:molecular chaperone TorD family protein [Metallosphaera tengchongensis]QKR00591.1 molecular chaperone TorD family protein [Metallosphaera tengchongensis]
MSVSILDVLNVRHATYDMFSELFLYKFHEEEYNELLNKLKFLDENLSKYMEETGVNVGEIRRAFHEAKRSDYLIEYSTLFLTGMGVKPLTPVESKRMFSLMGEKVATFKYTDVVRFLKSRGIVPKMSSQFSPELDHISSLLAFMSILIEEEFNLRSSKQDAFKSVQDQKNFATTHLFSWVPDWANDVVSDPRSNLYKVVCRELDNWLKFEKDFLGER